MIENDYVIIVNAKEIADMMTQISTTSFANPWKGEFREHFLRAGVIGYYKGKVVIHKE